MRKIPAEKCKPGMRVKDLDGNPTTITTVSRPFDGPVGPHSEPRRARYGRVVLIAYADGFKENVLASDLMYIFEEGE